MKKIIFIAILTLPLFNSVEAKELFKDLPADTVTYKTIRVICDGVGMDPNCGGYGKFGQLVTNLMGEIPYSELYIIHNNERYAMTAKHKCFDIIRNEGIIERGDSLAVDIDITIYPFSQFEGDDPLTIITDLRLIRNDSIFPK